MIDSEEAARRFCAERVGPAAMARLEALATKLAEENARQNLVSAASLALIWQRHFADSLQLLDHVPRETGPWLDLGSGAGFPGVPLAIARPDTAMILVESRKRRVDWLVRVASELKLENCRVIGRRLEKVDSFPAGAITARAFAPLDKLLALSARFSTPSTLWLLPKGRSAAQELLDQRREVREMFHVEQSRTDPGGGILVGRGTPRLR
ncbi:MAG TPA: 16S rRNA (guanine(527)-N(7))-methyltransferase RsmG [Croceibacterium sp.]|nr:16S rRNA (guanine(527)-N(7))-methyltransferase RsmG [Croceibacterium sp.]